MKSLACISILVATCLVSMPARAQQLPSGADLMVGYYGRPGAASLGVLGEHSIEDLVPLVKAKAEEYAKASGGKRVTPAFHLIYGLASSDPGRDKDYLLPLSKDKVMRYIDAGKRHGFAVILDTQLGEHPPAEAVKPLLAYLQHANVHLAIDPEFEVNGLDVRPGKVIGHISGEQVNQVQSAMADYMKEHGIQESKMLIVHMFTEHMVGEKPKIEKHDRIDLVTNLDGHGSPGLKVKTYNSLYSADLAAKSAGGFKLFFREDKPSLMTPRQVLGMDPAGKSRIQRPPRYINYQ
jgi:hypothetical protein